MYYHDKIQVDVLQSLDSGIDTSEENDNDDTPFEDTHLDSDKFSLCSSCTSSIPKVVKTFLFFPKIISLVFRVSYRVFWTEKLE